MQGPVTWASDHNIHGREKYKLHAKGSSSYLTCATLLRWVISYRGFSSKVWALENYHQHILLITLHECLNAKQIVTTNKTKSHCTQP